MADFIQSKQQASHWHHSWLEDRKPSWVHSEFHSVIQTFKKEHSEMIEQFFKNRHVQYADLLGLMEQRGMLQEFTNKIKAMNKQNPKQYYL